MPEARPEPTGSSAPTAEYALISRQEHEAWDVLLACQGQLRLAPSGHVTGIDMDAALKISAARGSDPAVLSELLPAAEAGLLEALCPNTGRLGLSFDQGPRRRPHATLEERVGELGPGYEAPGRRRNRPYATAIGSPLLTTPSARTAA